MSDYRTKIAALILIVFASLSPDDGTAQSGGGFEITEAVIAAGGGSSSNGIFEIETTLAQPASGGPMNGAPFSVTSGFWTFTPLAPTAAQAVISGRVRSMDGNGINNAVLYLQTALGEIYITRSSSFGYYMFEGIEIGQTVFITVEHKQFTFEPRSVMVVDSVSDFDFQPIQNPN